MRGYKTVIFGVLLAASAAVSDASMQAFIAEHIPAAGMAIGTAVIVLRALTSSAIFKKE